MKQLRFRFSHRAGGRYYWRRPSPEYGPTYEEVVSCSVLWFWGWVTDDTTLPPCDSDCEKRGTWGATGMMPDDNHILVRTENRQYITHKKET